MLMGLDSHRAASIHSTSRVTIRRRGVTRRTLSWRASNSLSCVDANRPGLGGTQLFIRMLPAIVACIVGTACSVQSAQRPAIDTATPPTSFAATLAGAKAILDESEDGAFTSGAITSHEQALARALRASPNSEHVEDGIVRQVHAHRQNELFGSDLPTPEARSGDWYAPIWLVALKLSPGGAVGYPADVLEAQTSGPLMLVDPGTGMVFSQSSWQDHQWLEMASMPDESLPIAATTPMMHGEPPLAVLDIASLSVEDGGRDGALAAAINLIPERYEDYGGIYARQMSHDMYSKWLDRKLPEIFSGTEYWVVGIFDQITQEELTQIAPDGKLSTGDLDPSGGYHFVFEAATLELVAVGAMTFDGWDAPSFLDLVRGE